MTKRLSIALIAVALFVVLAVMPASAVTYAPDNYNGTQIDLGATVFLGEQGLNLTHVLNKAITGYNPAVTNLNSAPGNYTIAWWASAADITKTPPTKTYQINTNYRDFVVEPTLFAAYPNNWYLLNPVDGTTPQKGADPGAALNGVALFTIADPTISVAAWDFSQGGKDVTGQSVPQGEHIGIRVNTNMYAATYANRNNTRMEDWETRRFTQGGLTSAPMPNAATSVWNLNVTDPGNMTHVGTANAGNVQIVYNYTYIAKLTGSGLGTTGDDFAANLWCNRTAKYFNSTAVAGGVNTQVGGTNPLWSAMNFTDATGLAPDHTVFGAETCYIGSFTNSVARANFPIYFAPNSTTDGYITLKVKDEAGAVYSSLYVGDMTNGVQIINATSLLRKFVNTQPWTFGTETRVDNSATSVGYWVTDATNVNGQYAYPTGTYSIWAESNLNNMKDNYKNAGADYTGKTVSATGTLTLVSDTVKIEANKDSVVRSKSFSITVTGKPSTQYYVWVKGTRAMTSAYDDMPPTIAENQEKIYFDNWANACNAVHPIGDYQYENGNQDSIWTDVAATNTTAAGGYCKTRYYALINTSTSGTRTVEWTTSNWTKAQKYTIRVEQNFPTTGSGYGAGYNAGTVKSDEVDVNVEKGAVTIVAAGDQSYYLGEEIKLSGTNTETYKTYLFLIGPNLPENGAQIANQDPRNNAVTDMAANTFKVIDVNGDNTWSWKWGTANYALDAGTYTIYAVSQPRNKEPSHLTNAAYGTVSIIIKKPFVSATASQSTVAKGDKVFITGTAQGDPSSVAIWIMGKNYAAKNTEAVNSDASFSYEIKQETTKGLSSGQYFVVVQHPMQNQQFDVDLNTTTTAAGTTCVGSYGYVYNRQLMTAGTTTGSNIFKLLCAGSLQGSDAAEALAEGINDANVDDTYTKLQFLVEEPTIRIDPIGDKHVGDKFTITAQTNLAVDDEVLVQVYSSSFKPTQKSQSGEFSGATGTVKVTKGDSGMNKISFDVDSSTFKPDEYIVTEDAVLQTATGTALFNVLETTAQTVAPTSVVTAAPTAIQTAAPTAVQTAAPTAAATTKSPGFGALIALIGLGAVAFVVVRRH